ncbi:MAG TPA: hypothetical protein VGG06_05495 [Thermoanaerobaculia bacterium]|jgi:hypothetical protein
MSYLDLPRIHFAGQFTTGPSTINNVTSNYNLARPLGPRLWNPSGSAYFQLTGCTVQSVIDDGTGDGSTDSLVGHGVTSTDNWGGGGVPAKIVDLDPQQQMVSMLYGLQIQIGDGEDSVIVDFEPVWFQDYVGFSAAYQSVLVSPVWGSSITSHALQRLQKLSPDLLSIKFVVDQPFQEPPSSRPPASRCLGRIVGTIGPGEADQPINFVEGRLLRPVGTQVQGLNFGPAIVQDRRLTIDLLNAIPWNSDGSPPDLGTLEVSFTALKGPTATLGTFDYSSEDRQTHALVQDFDLSGISEEDYQSLLNTPITVGQGPQAATFQEDPSGLYVDATPYVFRLEANAQAMVRFWAGRFGHAQGGVEIAIEDATSRLPANPPPPMGTAGAGGTPLSFTPASATTDASGYATVTIDGGNPANARGYIDGQVYALSFHPKPATLHPDPETFLSILVHDEFNAAATWEYLQPIMEQYARLYPFMSFVPLTDPEAIRDGGWIPTLLQVFSFPIEDPRYMPVVRDLSAAKQAAIVTWLNDGAPG